MKIIVVGGTGTIGKAVVNKLSARHEVIAVGHSKSEINVDISDVASIESMYKQIGSFDALVATTGSVKFAPLAEMRASDYEIGLKNKLMGQVNLVLLGLKNINESGSFTLTSGILSEDPIVLGSSAAMVNGALNAFAISAAIELPKHIRINVISPTVLAESMDKYASYFRGFTPVSADRVAEAYSKSVEGKQTGQIYKIW